MAHYLTDNEIEELRADKSNVVGTLTVKARQIQYGNKMDTLEKISDFINKQMQAGIYFNIISQQVLQDKMGYNKLFVSYTYEGELQ